MKLSISELTEVLVVIVVVVVEAVLDTCSCSGSGVNTILMPHGRVGPSQGPRNNIENSVEAVCERAYN